MNLQTYLMIKEAGKVRTVNKALKQLAAMKDPKYLGNSVLGHIEARKKVGATPQQLTNVRRGVARQYSPDGLQIFGGGRSYSTFQRGLAAEITGDFTADPRSIGLSEGALGKVLDDPVLYRTAYEKAPHLFNRK